MSFVYRLMDSITNFDEDAWIIFNRLGEVDVGYLFLELKSEMAISFLLKNIAQFKIIKMHTKKAVAGQTFRKAPHYIISN